MQQNWHSSLNWANTNWENTNCVIIKLGKLSRTQQNVLTVNRGYITDTSFKCAATFSPISWKKLYGKYLRCNEFFKFLFYVAQDGDKCIKDLILMIDVNFKYPNFLLLQCTLMNTKSNVRMA